MLCDPGLVWFLKEGCGVLPLLSYNRFKCCPNILPNLTSFSEALTQYSIWLSGVHYVSEMFANNQGLYSVTVIFAFSSSVQHGMDFLTSIDTDLNNM